MLFVNRAHMIAVTAAIGYITFSVPLHLYVSCWCCRDVSFYVGMAGYWFSYLLLCAVYPMFLDHALAAAVQELMPSNPQRRHRRSSTPRSTSWSNLGVGGADSSAG